MKVLQNVGGSTSREHSYIVQFAKIFGGIRRCMKSNTPKEAGNIMPSTVFSHDRFEASPRTGS
jgi:hypothetical protein